MALKNCKRCGTLFYSIGRNLCPDCLAWEEEVFAVVRDYVREHPSATVAQVSEATGVSVSRLYDWVRRGKLVAHSPQSDLAVDCTLCGERIVTGRLCDRCRHRMRRQGRAGQEDGSRLEGRVHLARRLRRPH